MSISHLEDLPPCKLLEVLSKFWEYEATEKLDGSQLLFGIDEDGFYTSRETKGGLRIYDVNHYELSFKNTYIRSTHIALESKLDLLKSAGLKVGCQVEVEVLYGEFPNAVQYSPDRSFIIFLRPTEGDIDIDQIRVKLAGQSLDISLIAPFTFNGKDIDYREVSNIWEFARSPMIDIDHETLVQDIYYHFNRLHQNLYSDRAQQDYRITNLDLLKTKLNSIPSWFVGNWATSKAEIKTQRDIEAQYHLSLALELKDVLLDALICGRPSAFGPVNGWIEGIVFRHPVTGDMFKLVDKKLFLKVKDFYWKERNELFKLAKSGYNSNDLDGRLDKYEKDKSISHLKIQRKKDANSTEQTVCFTICSDVDNRTKETFATLYQQEKSK